MTTAVLGGKAQVSPRYHRDHLVNGVTISARNMEFLMTPFQPERYAHLPGPLVRR